MRTPDSLGWADLQSGLDSRVLEGRTTLTLQQSRPRGQQGRGSRDHVASPQLPPLLSWPQPPPPAPDIAELEEVRMASFVPLN